MAPLHSRGAHLGTAITAIALALLVWFGKPAAAGLVSGVFVLWFSAALAWAYADGDHGRHAFRRAYNVTFGWGGDWF
ncbi:hypothetical protein [Streptomyces sp. NPDC000983]|uniref:hypothetical protein n=1 Tax=Streptomyces sp. NPDC000983 TaxID=3154373 RepID=UPI003326D80E